MRAIALLTLVLSATVVPQSVEQLTDRADVVVRATVLEQHAERAPGPAGIYTFTRLSLNERLKGSAPDEIVLRQPGGTLGAQTVELTGDAHLKAGEQVLLFLGCRPAVNYCTLIGLAQGKYHLEADVSGALQASRDFKGTAFVKGEPPSPGPEVYSSLAERIRSHVKAGSR
jgi:hypothetical protein